MQSEPSTATATTAETETPRQPTAANATSRTYRMQRGHMLHFQRDVLGRYYRAGRAGHPMDGTVVHSQNIRGERTAAADQYSDRELDIRYPGAAGAISK